MDLSKSFTALIFQRHNPTNGEKIERNEGEQSERKTMAANVPK